MSDLLLNSVPSTAHVVAAFDLQLVQSGARPNMIVAAAVPVINSTAPFDSAFAMRLREFASVAGSVRALIEGIATTASSVNANGALTTAERKERVRAALAFSATSVNGSGGLREILEACTALATSVRAVKTAPANSLAQEKAATVRGLFEAMSSAEAEDALDALRTSADSGDSDAGASLLAVLDAPVLWRSKFLPASAETDRAALLLAADPVAGRKLRWLSWAIVLGVRALDALDAYNDSIRSQFSIADANDLQLNLPAHVRDFATASEPNFPED